MSWQSTVAVGVLFGLTACATTGPTERLIALVPGSPIPAEMVGVEPGGRVTWVNGDPVRGEIEIEFDRVPNGPSVSSKDGIHTAKFSSPGVYAYTVRGHSRSGAQLVPRRGEVVVRDRSSATAPAPGPPVDQSPVGSGIVRLKSGADAYSVNGYRPDQGILLKVDRATAVPSSLSPGSQIILGVTYTVLLPPDAPPLALREVRTVRFADQDLRQVEKVVTVASGTYSSEHRLTVPRDAAEGPYTVTTLIEAPSVDEVKGQVSSVFSVRLP